MRGCVSSYFFSTDPIWMSKNTCRLSGAQRIEPSVASFFVSWRGALSPAKHSRDRRRRFRIRRLFRCAGKSTWSRMPACARRAKSPSARPAMESSRSRGAFRPGKFFSCSSSFGGALPAAACRAMRFGYIELKNLVAAFGCAILVGVFPFFLVGVLLRLGPGSTRRKIKRSRVCRPREACTSSSPWVTAKASPPLGEIRNSCETSSLYLCRPIRHRLWLACARRGTPPTFHRETIADRCRVPIG